MTKRVRNQILALGANLGLFVSVALPAYAITDPFENLTENPCTFIDGVATMGVGFVVLAAVIFFAIGGIQYMQSGGDKVAVEAARGKITGAVTGVIAGLGGYFIVRLITFIGRATAVPACVPQLPSG